MKKAYIKPETITLALIDNVSMLCGSVTDITTGITNDEASSDEIANSRRRSTGLWDEE